MIGWSVTAVWIAAFLVIAIWTTRRAAGRWWDYLIVFALAAPLVVPLYKFTGDVSRALPDWWTDGADRKDQIIFVSIAATLLWPLTLAALMVWALKSFMRRIKNR